MQTDEAKISYFDTIPAFDCFQGYLNDSLDLQDDLPIMMFPESQWLSTPCHHQMLPKKKVGRKRKAEKELLTAEEMIRLERNRIASLKCRDKRKEWLESVKSKVFYLKKDNEILFEQIKTMENEVLNIKTMLIAHKDCSVAKNNGSEL